MPQASGDPTGADAFVGIRDDTPFELRLAQAIAWCTPRATLHDPVGSLRSDSLRPRVLEVDRGAAVYGVLNYRTTDRSAYRATAVTSAKDLSGGRLLAYFPDAELSDGAAEQETAGFFDVNNAPPWDTWVALFRDPSAGNTSYSDYLVSWVPRDFVELAARGINVNPESCILWLADTRTPSATALGGRGWLQ